MLHLRSWSRVRHARTTMMTALALASLVTACRDVATGPTGSQVHPFASGGAGGGGKGGTPILAGPLAGTWSGAEAWGPAPASASWVVTVNQDAANPSALLGSAVAAIDPPNSDMNGAVSSSTHIAMNFIARGGKGGSRTITADLTLSADGSTLSGPISPSPVASAPATLTIHKQ